MKMSIGLMGKLYKFSFQIHSCCLGFPGNNKLLFGSYHTKNKALLKCKPWPEAEHKKRKLEIHLWVSTYELTKHSFSEGWTSHLWPNTQRVRRPVAQRLPYTIYLIPYTTQPIRLFKYFPLFSLKTEKSRSRVMIDSMFSVSATSMSVQSARSAGRSE